ncbi:hypothetical protein RintRC_3368 [Richelia intracellularis]|nr:hypothetical protein RintRC_3368 [Richelia intracellularis]
MPQFMGNHRTKVIFEKNLIPAKGVESRYPILATVDFALI